VFAVVPAVLLLILVMLALLLRALVAPLYLLATVLLSYLGTLGISLLTFKYVFGQPSVDPFFPLITFVFLVALGVDYNIFLMSRVREEALVHGTRVGLLRALVATGSVVTSAGLILAGTFAMLTILPLWILLEIGFTVSLGVLIDTFLVRTLAVPAIVRLVGDASWWPSTVTSGSRAPLTSGVFEVPPALRAQAPAAVD
jgi:RND superfamily putative drug exporter